MAAENAQQPKYDAGSCQDTESDGETSDAHTDWVMAINIESLGGPEHEDGEEICAGDEGDDESQGESTRILLESRWEHGEFGKLGFPDAERPKEGNSEDERNKDVGRFPSVLISDVRIDVCTESMGRGEICSPGTRPIEDLP